MALIATAWAWATSNVRTIVLGVAGLVVAGLLVWLALQWRALEKDRDRLARWGELVCVSAGAELAPAKEKRGESCARTIAALAKFKTDAITSSNQVLAGAAVDRQQRADADLAQATADADQRDRAAANMEKADAQVGKDDRVDGSWFGALNNLAGLRPSER